MQDMSSADWTRLWAKSKPRHPLWKHLLDSAAISLALPPPDAGFGIDARTRALLVGLHDIGKADPVFQHQSWTDPDGSSAGFSRELLDAGFPKTADARCRHERISAGFIRKYLTDRGAEPYTADAIARSIVAHHGYWVEAARNVAEPYARAQHELCRMLLEVIGVDGAAICPTPPSDLSAFGMQLAGHVVLCDWIASNEGFFTDQKLADINDPAEYLAAARTLAVEWIGKLDLSREQRAGNPAGVVKIPRPLQRVLLDCDIPPGLVIIEAPMGEGKTEAAWILAEKWREAGYHGMYMGLPTMATSDSLHKRYQDDYLKKLGRDKDVELVHGMAWLRDDKEPEKTPEVGEPGDDRSLAATWFRPTRRAMLAAHGVGTVDQAMLAGMNVKFGFLRLYGLADRILVIDEVHAYDAYMTAIIARLLNWCACLKIPVIMLSATLSAGQRAAMIEAYGATGGDPGPNARYPLVTVAEPGKPAQCLGNIEASSSRTLLVESHVGLLGEEKKAADLAEDLFAKGGCCCVILNTVRQAQAVYSQLKLPKRRKMLFHARFTAADREKIANIILRRFGRDTSKRPGRFVLVATQVVEQSLDVDFDHMITEIAPIDLLLQRSGRMHRHRKRDHDPILHVLLPEAGKMEFGGTGYVYAEKTLLRTIAILAAQPDWRLPEDFRTLIERCYGDDEWEQAAVPWETIRKADEEWASDTQSLTEQAKQFAFCAPSKRRFRPVNNDPTGDDSDDGNGWRAKTRLGANDATAVLVDEAELRSLEPGEMSMRQVRSLYRRSVKLPRYLPLDNPAPGYGAAVEARGRLRGLLLLPVTDDLWRGLDDKGNQFEISYDSKLGLRAGRVQ
jgi:CRISPR-associated endonuclease/helicase Cas3